jgi:hypothetical protein
LTFFQTVAIGSIGSERKFNLEMKMMRILLVNVVTIGLMLAGATSASAISFFFDAPSTNGPLNAGEQFTINYRMDTEGETGITSVFTSTFLDPALFTFVSGSSPGSILFSFATFSGIGKLVDPYVDGGDAPGTVRSGGFGALSPSGVASANQLLATLTFEANEVIGDGNAVGAVLGGLIAPGDDVTVNTISVAGDLGPGNFASSQVIQVNTVVPEPTTALLMGLGLAGLATAGRRKN